MRRAGKLLFSDAKVDAHTGQVTLRGEFPNPKRELLPGMYVRVLIEQGIDTDAIAVPQQAIQRNGGGGSEVFVVKDDDRVAVQPVRTGSVQDGQWFVTEGLKAGDKVVVEGFQKFAAGDKVRPQSWTEADASVVARCQAARRPRKRTGRRPMPSFFIDRPIFAWVVALFICLIGAISIPLLAVAQYPIIAPPSISISTSYPGASPENLYNSVTRLIEEELNGANGILNFESTSDSLGQVDIIANFVPGTDTGTASVEVQNRIKRVEARLPRAVIQQGILVEEASSAVLQIITLRSTDGSLDEVGLGDFMIRNVLGEIRRIPGVGRATLYSTERSLRIWIDPAKLVGYGLTADDVNKAITAQNAQVASGSIGAEPSTPDQKISALVLVKGQLTSPDEFGADHPARQSGRLDGAAARRRPHRDRRPELSVQHQAQRQADRRSFGAAVADRQRAGHRQRGRSQDEGAVALLPRQYRLRHSLQHHAGREGLDREGADRRWSRRWCWSSS